MLWLWDANISSFSLVFSSYNIISDCPAYGSTVNKHCEREIWIQALVRLQHSNGRYIHPDCIYHSTMLASEPISSLCWLRVVVCVSHSLHRQLLCCVKFDDILLSVLLSNIVVKSIRFYFSEVCFSLIWNYNWSKTCQNDYILLKSFLKFCLHLIWKETETILPNVKHLKNKQWFSVCVCIRRWNIDTLWNRSLHICQSCYSEHSVYIA